MELKTVEITKIKYRPFSIADPNAINQVKLEHFIRQYGQIKPLVVVKDDDEYYEILDGNRVFKALWRIGAKTVECIVYTDLSPVDRILYAINLNLFHVFHDEVSVAAQILQLVEKHGKAKVPYLTPFCQEEINNFIDLANFDWEQYKAEDTSIQISLFPE